jgi:2-polyprenyl-3-methyl-5-hydroxy-6-metoxy-1,4-benzoquinol methylase
MNTNLYRTCPICDCETGEVLLPVKFFLFEDHPLPSEYNIVSCDNCNFVFADSAASQDEYDEFYTSLSKYEGNQTSGAIEDKPWEVDRFIEIGAFLDKHFPDKSTSFLDIGCANGGLLRQLKKNGYSNLCGVDPSISCVKNTAQNGDIKAFPGTAFKLPNVGLYDVVILSHTLEHLYDIKRAVTYLTSFIAEDGCLFIEVPNASEYFEYLTSPLQDFNVEHINHFSIQSLQNLIQPLGFKRLDYITKVIEAPEGIPVPAIASLWKANTFGGVKETTLDRTLKLSINKYINESLAVFDKISGQLENHLNEFESFIIWGTGQLAFKLLNYTCLKNAKISQFVDNNPINQGKKLRGIPIVSPSSIDGLQPIIITSISYDAEIRNQIKAMDLPNQVISLAENNG